MEIDMNGSIQLTIEQRFQIEQFNRTLETTTDPEQLRQLARQLMKAWQTQKAATSWVMKQGFHRSTALIARAPDVSTDASPPPPEPPFSQKH